MDPTVLINERVEVAAVYRRQADIAVLCMPSKMRWRGKEVIFTELALRHPTVAGKRMIHVFHVSDGMNDYRLEFDAEALTWTLIAVMPATVEVLR
jgi:hypothetical protein